MTNFDNLPLELCTYIFSFCQTEDFSFEDTLRLGLVCKKWHRSIKYVKFDIFLNIKKNNSLYIDNLIKNIKIKKLSIYVEKIQDIDLLKNINNICRNIKDVSLTFDEDIFFEEIKTVVNLITNVDNLYCNFQDIFGILDYDNDFFPTNKRIKSLQLIDTDINNKELYIS